MRSEKSGKVGNFQMEKKGQPCIKTRVSPALYQVYGPKQRSSVISVFCFSDYLS